MPSDPEVRQVAQALRNLNDRFLQCRDPGIRHPWDVVVDMHVMEQKQEGRRRVPIIGRDSMCLRCGTQKTEIFMVGRNGLEKIRNDYTYPEDYRIAGVPRGVKQSMVIWQEQYRRAMEQAAGTAPGEREGAER